MSTRSFVLLLSIAAVFTMLKYLWQADGSVPEKVDFLRRALKHAITGVNEYLGRHRFNKRLPTTYATGARF